MNIPQILETLLKHIGESEAVEFKEAKQSYDFKKLGKYFSALSNEANLKGLPRAWLVFGIKNNHSIVGSNFRLNPSNLDSLKGEIARHSTNNLTFIDIHIHYTSQGRVILFEIPSAPKGIPLAWQGHYFGRNGSELAPLNLEEIERIRNQNKITDWSAGICTGAKIKDLDAGAIKKARLEYANKNSSLREQIPSWDDVRFLNKAKLCIQGQVTRAAILLLGKSESSHFLNPASSTISWILKDKDGIEKDYSHYSCPLLLTVDEVYQKVRNLKYRYISEGSLFPEEVDQYDPFLIREALHNAIAHQDYEMGGKVNMIEFEDNRLSFSNLGEFIPGSLEKVLLSDAPESSYRNRFLSDAMVNLNMIDTIGSGIRKMFFIQKNRFFPLPEYQIINKKVLVQIMGKVLDVNYAKKLAQMPELSLNDIILLDKVQKKKHLNEDEIRGLKKQKLIEGRKPNFHISAVVAQKSGEKSKYILNKAFDDEYYKKMILEYIEKFGTARRKDLNSLLLDKLPAILDENQKAHNYYHNKPLPNVSALK